MKPIAHRTVNEMGTSPHMLAATALIFIALGLGFGAWAGSVPLVKTAFGLDALHLGGVLLAVATGSIVSMSRMGRVVAHHGARACAIAAGAGFALAFLPLLLASGWRFGAFLACAALLGAAMGAMDVAMNAMASGIERSTGRSVMSRLHAGFSLGGFGGALVASTLLARGVHLAGLYAAAAVLVALPMTLAAWRARRADAPNPAPTPAASTPPPDRVALPGAALGVVGALTALAMICEGAVGDWGGIFTTEALGAPPDDGPLGYAAFSATMVAMRLAGDRVRERFGATPLMAGGALVAMLGLLAVAAAPTPVWALAGFALTGIGLATLVPLAYSLAGQLGERAAGEAGAARALARAASWGYGGFLLGPPLVSAVIAATSLRGGFASLAATALAMAGLVAWLAAGRSRSAR